MFALARTVTLAARPTAGARRLASVAPARAGRAALAAAPKRAVRGASVAAAAIFGFPSTASADAGIYGLTAPTADGGKVNLSKYKGKVMLVVNVASACGFTPQYTGLADLSNKYPDLVVIAQPCNQFGGQEPGSNADVSKFAKGKGLTKGVILAKADVNGPAETDLFKFLKAKKGGIMGNDIKWNFTKFLVDRTGNVVGRYPSTTTPEAIEADIKKYI